MTWSQSQSGWYKAEWRLAPLAPFPCEARPSSLLSRREFAYYQRRDAARWLSNLTHRAWDTFRFAKQLLEPAVPLPDRPEPDVSSLHLPWDSFCRWYREVKFDDQLDFFRCPQENEIHRWHMFIERRVCRSVLQNAWQTRSLLVAAGMVDASSVHIKAAAENFSMLLEEIGGACLPHQSTTTTPNRRSYPGND